MKQTLRPILLACRPELLVDQLPIGNHRVLIFGQPGIGKTTLAAGLAGQLAISGHRIFCLGADPGSPDFGVPGAVCLGTWQAGKWSPVRVEPLCTLDAARFRLPLVSAVAKLAAEVTEPSLLLDAPGVVRGVAGAELLDALVRTAAIDLVLVLMREGQSLPLADELNTLTCDIAYLRASLAANRPSKARRARSRSSLWDRYLTGAIEHRIALESLNLVGTPPRKAVEAWLGKQVAFLKRDRSIAMGEVSGFYETTLSVLLPAGVSPTKTLLVRDACRNEENLLVSSKRFADGIVRYIPRSDVLPDALLRSSGVRPLVQVGKVTATLMNGIFGDPLLHLRLGQSRRSLMFDLGDGSRLPARIAHQVSDVFISHAHMDHISGFLWLLRSRIGETSICRLYGPPGLAAHIEGLISGIRWDRIGDHGPLFEVLELHDNRLHGYRLQAGKAGRDFLGEEECADGVLLAEVDFQVQAVTLDHGTPVLAYAYQPSLEIKVRKERLQQRKLKPGPWLNDLKRHILAAEHSLELRLPDGRCETVERLSEDLILVSEGKKLVYATDFSDTPDNRQRLMSLATGAHTLFCESTFLLREEAQAKRSGHLTTRSCAEIANQAGVQYLIPFHFSRRYEKQPWQVYDEIAALCPQVVMPQQGS